MFWPNVAYKYASALQLKASVWDCNSWLCSEGNFLTMRPFSVYVVGMPKVDFFDWCSRQITPYFQ